ncbi:uncharacterized protein isoform X3 [Castor canadensis]|uniref:Uncharacterized protein isoform X3 n=1 Tax=Castor canadensis TaxID=51338 RepID=A0AC58KNI2_CASCN
MRDRVIESSWMRGAGLWSTLFASSAQKIMKMRKRKKKKRHCQKLMIRTENIEDEDDDNEEQVLPELDPRKDDVLVQVQVGEVTQLLQQLQEKREASFSLSHQLEDLHTQENPDNHEDHGDQPAEACSVEEPFVYKMSAENHNDDDDDDDDDEDSLNSRLNSQLQEEKVKEVFTGSSGEEYFHPCTHPDQLDSQECLRGTALPLDGPKVSPALNQNQSDLDASIEVKNPEMLECNTAEGLVNNMHEFQHGFLGATNVLKQEIIKRILLFSKWRNECRFPGSTGRGWFCPTNDVTSASSYLEFPWAVAVSIPASSSPMCILSSDPKQPCSSNTLTAIGKTSCLLSPLHKEHHFWFSVHVVSQKPPFVDFLPVFPASPAPLPLSSWTCPL